MFGLPVGAPVDLETSIAYFSPSTRSEIRSAVKVVVREGRDYCLEGTLHRADGVVLRVKATGKPRYTGNRVTHVYGALEDVTEQYRLLETQYNYTAYGGDILELCSQRLAVGARVILCGLADAPQGFVGLLSGDNVGKMIVKISD